MHKLYVQQGDDWVPMGGKRCFAHERLGNGTERLRACIPDGGPDAFVRLTGIVAAPYLLLYVLHTPRGEAEAGRYQSPPLSMEALAALIDMHKQFLSSDARFDLWAHSAADRSTVVWDRHNHIYGYGDLSGFATALATLGFAEEAPPPLGAHQHVYRPEMDSQARSFMAAFPWTYSPLRPEDEQ